MGARGPAPARSDERRRTNEPAAPITKMGPEEMAGLPFPIDLAPETPDIDELQQQVDYAEDDELHPYARYLWEKLQVDPSRKWNGPAAQALDVTMIENISRLLKPRVAGVIQPSEFNPEGEVKYARLPLSGSELAAILKWASARGIYEGDRLRLGKEITFYGEHGGAPAEDQPGGQVISMQRDRRLALAQQPDVDPLSS